MNMNKLWKRFWTLNRNHAGGFTLVELIVVIAILAILAGVAVPAYSGYVTKANMAADEALIRELYNIALVGVMDNHDKEINSAAVIKVGVNGALIDGDPTDNLVTILEEAMINSYGSDWYNICKLKYAEWSFNAGDVVATYEQSSIAGKEEELLGTASQLAGNFADFMSTGRNKPQAIVDLMEKYGYDADNDEAFANAAVMALANDISSNPDTQAAIIAELSNLGPANLDKIGQIYAKHYGGENVTNLGELQGEQQDMAILATTATLYAFATEFAHYTNDVGGSDAGLTILNNLETTLAANASSMSANQIMNTVQNAFGQIYNTYSSGENSLYSQYMAEGGQASKDADALMAVMGGVSESEKALSANMGTTDCFKDATNIVTTYLNVGKMLDSSYPAGVIVSANGTVTRYLNGVN